MPATMPFFLFSDVFLQNEMYCIFCPDSGNVSGFFSPENFFPSFQICICSHKFSLKIAKSFIF